MTFMIKRFLCARYGGFFEYDFMSKLSLDRCFMILALVILQIENIWCYIMIVHDRLHKWLGGMQDVWSWHPYRDINR